MRGRAIGLVPMLATAGRVLVLAWLAAMHGATGAAPDAAASSPASGAHASSPASGAHASSPTSGAPGGDDLYAYALRQYERKLPPRACDEPQTDFPRWQGFPVRLCTYSDVGVTVRTYMLNPSAQQLARWTATACAEVAASAPRPCVETLAKAILGASSGVFPVSGFIPEPASSAGGSGNAALCLLFRDGLTVATRTVDGPRAVGGRCPDVDVHQQTVVRAKRFARVASTSREHYKLNGGTLPVGTDADGDPRWLDAIRSAYQAAWNSPGNELITARARSLVRAGARP